MVLNFKRLTALPHLCIWILTLVCLSSFLESSQQLCAQSRSVRTERLQMEKTVSGLTPADKPANVPAQQQQIRTAEQKSRMDLQMSTALHGTAAFTHLSLYQHTTTAHAAAAAAVVSHVILTIPFGSITDVH